MRRRAYAAVVGVIFLSLAVLSFLESRESYRAHYWGEDMHALLLVTAREACRDPYNSSRVYWLFNSTAQKLRGVKLAGYNYSINRKDNSSDRGWFYCSWTIGTNVGVDAFTLNYSYAKVYEYIDRATSETYRYYRVEARQVFRMPTYGYDIAMRVELTPLCWHQWLNETTLVLRGRGPCTLVDKWGLKVVVGGG